MNTSVSRGRTTWYESVEQMQTDLDSYLEHYNNPAATSGQDDGGTDALQHVQEGSEIDTEEKCTKVA